MVGWMDTKVVLSDIYLETPVGWLDDPKKTGHSVEKTPVG